MDINEYKKKALRTDYADYSDFHTGDVTPRLDYSVIGLVTESSKILDLVKKSKKSLHPLEKQRVIEELGDLLWYLNLTLDELGLSFEDIMQANLDKISKKYPENDLCVTKLIRGNIG
jgi:NTP pyrophosphatase (non-canonical NTP hydrolase)